MFGFNKEPEIVLTPEELVSIEKARRIEELEQAMLEKLEEKEVLKAEQLAIKKELDELRKG